MKLENEHPVNLAGRILLLEKLRAVDPKDFKEKFAKKMPQAIVTYDESDPNGEFVEVVEYNWEYLVFDTTMHQLQSIFQEFFKQEKKAESKIIGVEGDPMVMTGQGVVRAEDVQKVKETAETREVAEIRKDMDARLAELPVVPEEAYPKGENPFPTEEMKKRKEELENGEAIQ